MSPYDDVVTVNHNTVLEQVELAFDEDSNTIQTTVRQRYHNAGTGVGAGEKSMARSDSFVLGCFFPVLKTKRPSMS